MVDQNSDISLGEIFRKQLEMAKSLDSLIVEVRNRDHELRDDLGDKIGRVQADMVQHIGPVAVLQADVKRHEGDLKDHAIKIEQVSTNAARVSGAAALLAFIVSAIPLPWKH